MKTKEFLDRIDDARIVAAIADAERKSSGQIRIFVSRKEAAQPMADAQAQFRKLGMEKTKDRNGVLLFLSPKTQQFAIIGDTGIHEKCGPAFWEEIAASMVTLLKEGKFTEALLEAIQRTGSLLARHFPREDGDTNELPDQIIRD